jgi:hypothetical protein
VPHERSRIHVPNRGNLVTFQVGLRRFTGAPIRRDLREIAHDERFDVRPRGLLILGIRADISNVGIRQADNLAAVTGVGEYFLIAREAGIKNNFSAAAATGACRAALKYSSVLERDDRAGSVRLLQLVLRAESFSRRSCRGRSRNLSEVVEGPVGEHRLAVNVFLRHRSKDT